MPEAAQLRYAALSDAGQLRANNEDSWLADARLGLFAVCDGMGGAAAGEVASRLATEVLVREVRFRHSYDQPADVLQGATRAANAAIFQLASDHTRLRGMGTTIVALLFPPAGDAVLCHAGDSRCYRWRADSLQQLTRDHTVVQEELQDRRMTAAEANRSPLKHVLTRAAGVMPELEPDVALLPVEPGDLFLLCSDGLTNEVDDAGLGDLLRQSLPEGLQQAASALVAEANRRGGEDNITVVLVQVP